jgi:integrase
MALCMVDLGLRPVEVIGLTLTDVDWNRSTITVPATKTNRGRQLPMVDRIASALRGYVQHHRPATDCDRLFVRFDQKRIGTVMDSRCVAYAMEAAYRRCKFPGRWVGAYRLRHTFATRLHARGADLKQIADLLGHQHLQTTTIYAKTDVMALRALAFAWPL